MKDSLGLLVASACISTLASCALFSGKPPLPKHASIEQVAKASANANFAAAVEDAEVIYFPSERAASGARSEPAALLVEALQKRGEPFAIGWDLIAAAQQPLLDRLDTETNEATREQVIAELELEASGRAREHCRAVLREARAIAVHHLALRCPIDLLAKVTTGEKLTAEEQDLVPRGYKNPPKGFQTYAASLPLPTLGDRQLAQSYRAELVRQRFAAEKIVQHLRVAAAGSKLLVFLDQRELENDEGVPFYVAQKISVRQLVLGGSQPTVEQKLLTLRRRGLQPRFQVVNGAPLTGRD